MGPENQFLQITTLLINILFCEAENISSQFYCLESCRRKTWVVILGADLREKKLLNAA